MKVAQFSSARFSRYGAGVSMLTLADGLRREGHEVVFGGFRGRGLVQELRSLGYSAEEVRVRSKFDPLSVLAVSRWLKKIRPDVLHCHLSTSSFVGGLGAKIAGVPSVATVHGLSHKSSFLTVDRLIAVSEEVKRHLVQQGVRSDRIDVVYNGLPPEFGEGAPDRLEARAAFGLPPDAPIYGTVARLAKVKGLELQVQALQLLPDAHLVLAGDGEEREPLEALARSLGVFERVHFLGFQQDVPKVLAALDVFVMTSHKEAQGIALVEAMAMGLPSVAIAVGGVPEVLDKSCGVLLLGREADGLAKSLSSLLNKQELRSSQGLAARERQRRLFSQQAMTDSALACYVRARPSSG